jgi:Zn-dependent protease with chaperone function
LLDGIMLVRRRAYEECSINLPRTYEVHQTCYNRSMNETIPSAENISKRVPPGALPLAFINSALIAVLVGLLIFDRSPDALLYVAFLALVEIQLVIIALNLIRTMASYSGAQDHLERSPSLEDLSEEVGLASGMGAPRILFIDDNSLNAFSMRRGRQGTVFLTRGLIEALDRDELRAVIAHEQAHIKHGDSSVRKLSSSHIPISLLGHFFRTIDRKTLASIIPFFLAIAALAAAVAFAAGNDNPSTFIALLITSILAPLFFFVVSTISAKAGPGSYKGEWEYAVDETAAYWVMNPPALASALQHCILKGAIEDLDFLNFITFVPITTKLDDYRWRESGNNVARVLRNQPSVEDRITSLEKKGGFKLDEKPPVYV